MVITIKHELDFLSVLHKNLFWKEKDPAADLEWSGLANTFGIWILEKILDISILLIFQTGSLAKPWYSAMQNGIELSFFKLQCEDNVLQDC